MIQPETQYCLDSNVFIQAWQKYYSPEICPDYWNLLSELGKEEKIFISQMVYDEIKKISDDLFSWLKQSSIPVHEITGSITIHLNEIYEKDPMHKLLVDNAKGRSLADPWVIAHAIEKNAVVVTKEEKITSPTKKRIKMPNVCENMGVRWINDFQFVEEMNFKFSCYRLK